jgi:uncharacterized protein (DUF1499 family)
VVAWGEVAKEALTVTRRSRIAVLAGALGALGIFDLLLGPALIHAGAVSPMFGFQWMFGLGLLEAIAGLAVGLVALHRTRAGSGLAGRGFAWTGIGAGLAAFAILALALRPGAGLPAINDITTDPEDPPFFSATDRDMSYPGEHFASQQRAAYPDLEPIRVSSAPDRALTLARETAESLGWEIVSVDPAAGRLEAKEVSRIFRFVDDVVVRVRPAPTGAVIDVRSRSRDGRGDLGVNARRIRAFAAEIPR